MPCCVLPVSRSARVLQFDASQMESLREAASELLPRVDAGGQTAVCDSSRTRSVVVLCRTCSQRFRQAGACASNSTGHSVRPCFPHFAPGRYCLAPACFASGRTLSRFINRGRFRTCGAVRGSCRCGVVGIRFLWFASFCGLALTASPCHYFLVRRTGPRHCRIGCSSRSRAAWLSDVRRSRSALRSCRRWFSRAGHDQAGQHPW